MHDRNRPHPSEIDSARAYLAKEDLRAVDAFLGTNRPR